MICPEAVVIAHAHKTCVLPPNTKSIIPASLKCNADIPPDGLVGIIESNPTLATQHQVCGAATLVKAIKQSTVPFRVINPTTQPVTICRCTNLGQFSSYEELNIVSVLGTHNVVKDKSQRAKVDIMVGYINVIKKYITVHLCCHGYHDNYPLLRK